MKQINMSKIENDFIQQKVLENAVNHCQWWATKVVQTKIDEIEHQIHLKIEEGENGNEIDQIQLEKLCNDLEWQRDRQAEWVDAAAYLNDQLPKTKQQTNKADALSRAQQLIAK